MKMTGAEILVNCLLEQGVDTVFGYPGGAVLNLYDALYQYSGQITHIRTCHEQAAAHAADGYARSTGRTGVVIATSGPGATNLVTGIATAYMDSVPLVAITGNVARHLLGKDSFQEVNITGITRPVTKRNYMVAEVEDLAAIIREAFQIAASGRPGPVLIDIPKDVTAAEAEYQRREPEAIQPVTEMICDEATAEAVRLIQNCERPFVFAGGGVIASGSSGELFEFSRRAGAPVALSLTGLGAFPADDEYFTGMIGMHGSRASSLAVTDCDLLIAAGVRFSDRVLCSPEKFAPNAKVIHIEVDPKEINKNIRVDCALTGDLREVLKRLNARLKPADRPEWLGRVGDWKRQLPIEMPERDAVTPWQVIRTLRELTGGEAIITTEVGQHQIWVGQYYGFNTPRSFVTSGGLGTMGFGLGAAIGAQAGNPGKRVVNIAGDGSFHMNLQELTTAVTYHLPVIELVMNNGVLGMVRQWQKIFYEGRLSQTTLQRQTDYIKLAEAFGARGFVIDSKDAVVPVLKTALEANQPCVIDCRIDRDFNVLPMVPAGAPINEPILEME
ncbi:MAG TPA: biosynthetic-type acetolactate synthase large subunit [Clostridia bacterium]|nr:biosynthetic-type acetolactate synthase large subunit [Clostridia bacterium]